MYLLTILTTLSTTTITTAIALPHAAALPRPTFTNITYSGSACPENGLTFTLGNLTAVSNSTSSAPLTFTLSNFLPSFGSFGSSLRMCNAVTFISVEKGWRVRVNEKGTTAKGEAQLPRNATMYFRDTWMFAEPPFEQSIGMLDVPGPLEGAFSQLVTPVEGNGRGVEGDCEGGETELDVEFQARAVNDTYGDGTESVVSVRAVDTAWSLTTDVEVLKC